MLQKQTDFFYTEIVCVFSSLYVYVFSIAGLAFLLLVCLPAAREQMLYIFRGKNVDFLQHVKHYSIMLLLNLCNFNHSH